MKKIKLIFASLLVIMTVALAVSYNLPKQSFAGFTLEGPDGIDTLPMPYSLRRTEIK